MSYSKPDYWVLIKIVNKDNDTFHYRVFGSWSGSYIHGDSWRMNSGIVSMEETGDTYEFKGSSGSVYSCWKERYGSTVYVSGIIKHYEETYPEVFFPLTEDEALSIVERDEWPE